MDSENCFFVLFENFLMEWIIETKFFPFIKSLLCIQITIIKRFDSTILHFDFMALEKCLAHQMPYSLYITNGEENWLTRANEA